MPEPCVVLLAGRGPSSNIVYHALRRSLSPEIRLEVVLENPVSKISLLRRRIRRLGLLPVVGHVLFMGGAVPLLRARGKTRIQEIKAEHKLDDSPISGPVHGVGSANDQAVIDLIRSLDPSVVVVNGTRILSRDVLAATRAPFINMHAGITPAYRGVHGGYWALAERRPELVGTTVHRVDEGIDTGAIIGQAGFEVTSRDTFTTYPYLHIAAGLPLLTRAVNDALNNNLEGAPENVTLPSVLRYHPTLWAYLSGRLMHGVR
jgi:folate-dependent phosphoribosylglycinamide formyltransferase PurN